MDIDEKIRQAIKDIERNHTSREQIAISQARKREYAIPTIGYWLKQKFKKYNFSDELFTHIASRYWDEHEEGETFDEWAKKHWDKPSNTQESVTRKITGGSSPRPL